MSKILCHCGNTIFDSTDFINYKARFIADQDHFDFIDAAENNNWMDLAKTLGRYSQEIFQCINCGNVIFLTKNERFDFQPLNQEKCSNLLNSYLGENWKGFMRGNFRDGSGEIYWQTNVDSGFQQKISLEKLKDIYFAKLLELRELDIIRNSFLRINGVIEHEFDIEKQ